jgi:hypothetical protein
MTNEELVGIYFQWSCRALLGGDPVATDKFLNDNIDVIKTVAQVMLKKVNYYPTEIYRGIILPEEVDELKPHKNFTYLSFSEDRKIAESFADPSPSGFGTLFFLGEYGYLIKYVPKIEEIIFHYSFLNLLPYQEVFIKAGYGDDLLVEQKEVTILQPQEPFKRIFRYGMGETGRNDQILQSV